MVLIGGAVTIFNKVKKQTTGDDHVNIQMYYICAVSKHRKEGSATNNHSLKFAFLLVCLLEG